MTEDEKEEVTEMLYKYKEAFSLRDEIGTCPNIEVGIDVIHISKNAHRIKYFSLNVAIICKHNFRMFRKQKAF